jgi:hypothetical protein
MRIVSINHQESHFCLDETSILIHPDALLPLDCAQIGTIEDIFHH